MRGLRKISTVFYNRLPGVWLLFLLLLFGFGAKAQLNINLQNKKDACDGTSNGSIEIVVTNSSGPISLFLIGGSVSESYVATEGEVVLFENLPVLTLPLDYLVVANDGINPVETANFEIFNITPNLVASVASQSDNTSCSSPNGDISLSVSGGTTNYTFNWTGPAGPYPDSDNLSGLQGGDYFVDVLDDGTNCFRTIGPITIADPTIVIQTISTASPLEICPGDDAILGLSGSESGKTYEILVNGTPSGFTEPGSGGAISLTLPSANFTDGDNLTIEASEGVCPSQLMSGNVIISQIIESVEPTSATADNTNYCDASPPANITLSYTGGILGDGATAEWYDDPGLTPADNVGAGNNFLITPVPLVTTTYYVRFEGTCNTTSTASVTITVDSPLDATITPAGPFCVDNAPINLTALTPGGNWSGTGITDAVNGTFDPATAGAGTHTITYTLTNGACVSFDTENIVVNPLPDATITPAGPFCIDAASVNLTAATPGGTWSGTGITDPVAGTFDPAIAGVGTHTISYNITDLNGCSNSDSEDLVVNPLPDATITAAGPFCVDEASINLVAATSGGTWSGVGITDPIAGTFDPATAGPGTHTINYTITDANGCMSMDSEDLIVNPLPDATITPAGPFCVDASPSNLTAATAGGTWSGTGITDNSLGTFDPATAGVGTHTITYMVTDLNSCSNSATVDIIVNPLPDATITPAGPFCVDDASVNLTAATAGGTWSGVGIIDGVLGTFDPATAGAGTHTITYSFTDGNGCTGTDSEDIIVNPILDPTITPAGPFCVDATPVNLVAATPGGTWSGIGITDPVLGTFDPAVALVGTHTITYSITNGACMSTDMEDIVVNPIPDATITPAGPFCLNAGTLNLTAATPGGLWSGSGITDVNAGTFDPAIAGVGTHTITYSITDGNGCSNAATQDVVVNPLPDATITPAGPFCIDAAAINLTAATPGGAWSGAGITDAVLGTFNPAVATAGTHTITYSITDASGCTSLDTEDIIVNPLPDVTITAAGPFCEDNGVVNLSAATPGGTWSGNGITDGTLGVFDPAIAGPGTHAITYTLTDANSCTNLDIEDFVVDPQPIVDISGNFLVCENSTETYSVAGGEANYLWSITGGDGMIVSGQGTETISVNWGLVGGALNVDVTGAAPTNCTQSNSSNVLVINFLDPLPDDQIEACQNQAAPTLIAFVLIPGVTINWYLGPSTGTPVHTGDVYTPLASELDMTVAGTTVFTYTQTIGCLTSADASYTVVIEPQPSAGTGNAINACVSDTPIDLFTVLGGTPDMGGTWSDDDGSGALTGSVFDPATAGVGMYNFTYLVNGLGSCSSEIASANVSVSVINTSTTPVPEQNEYFGCTYATPPTMTTPGTTIRWYADAALTSQIGAGNSFTPLGGLHIDTTAVGTTSFFVTQDDGCGESEPAMIDITLEGGSAEIGEIVNTYPEQNIGAIEVVNIQTDFPPYEVRLEDTDGNVIYNWAAVEEDRLGNFNYLFTLLSAGDYVIWIRDDNGCMFPIIQPLTNETEVFIPNVFTPNGDNYNDVFKVLNVNGPIQIRINNRWGVKVFESDDYQNDWDASNLPEGVYFYNIKMAGVVYRGNVEVWRNDGPAGN